MCEQVIKVCHVIGHMITKSKKIACFWHIGCVSAPFKTELTCLFPNLCIEVIEHTNFKRLHPKKLDLHVLVRRNYVKSMGSQGTCMETRLYGNYKLKLYYGNLFNKMLWHIDIDWFVTHKTTSKCHVIVTGVSRVTWFHFYPQIRAKIWTIYIHMISFKKHLLKVLTIQLIQYINSVSFF